MEEFFNRLLCELTGHKETKKIININNIFRNEDIEFDSYKFLKAHEICLEEFKTSPWAIVKCERCGQEIKNGPETFIEIYSNL